MAAKVRTAPAKASASGTRAPRRGPWIISAGLVVTLIAGWIWTRHAGRIAAALPPEPPLAGRPAELADRLAEARTLAANRRTALEGVTELGLLYHANGYHAEAAACWRLLMGEQPREARWTYLLADVHRRDNDYPAMRERLKQTVQQDPSYAAAWLKLAEVEFKSGNLADAAAHHRRRLELLPGDPYARLGLARVARQQQQTVEARRLIADLVRSHPWFSAAQNIHAEALAAEGDAGGARKHRWLGREAGRFREAEDPWLAELTARCTDPGTLRLIATVDFQTGHGDRGVGLMERVVQLAPDRPGSYEAFGDLLLKLNQPARARDMLARGLALPGEPPASIPHFAYLNEACRQLKRLDEAMQVAGRGLAQYPDAFELHNALGVTLDDLGRREEALAAYRRAVELNPGDAECNFNLAAALIGQERIADAYAALRRSLTLQPTFPKALKLLAKIELESGRPERAEEYLRPLYDAQTGDPEVCELMLEWLLPLGRNAEARRVVADGLELAHTLNNRGMITYYEQAARRVP